MSVRARKRRRLPGPLASIPIPGLLTSALGTQVGSTDSGPTLGQLTSRQEMLQGAGSREIWKGRGLKAASTVKAAGVCLTGWEWSCPFVLTVGQLLAPPQLNSDFFFSFL